MIDDADRTASDESVLERIVRRDGDPRLFPPEVVRLHQEGKGLQARKALLRHAKTERDPVRQAKQRTLSNELRLWLEPISKAPPMVTWNGIGSNLYGKYQEASDGTYIATIWFVVFFIPWWPLAAFLVHRAEQGGGWHFLARSALPPLARRARIGAIAALLAAMVVAQAISQAAATHTDVYVFNAFDKPVLARVGNAELMVPPRRHEVFKGVRLDSTTVSAQWEGDLEPFESFAVDLSGHRSETVVYNVAAKGVFWVEYVVYGDATPQEGHMLERGPVIFVGEEIDYPFATPPESLYVSEGSYIENSVLMAFHEGLALSAFPDPFGSRDGRPLNLEAARLLLEVQPENAELAMITASYLLSQDPDAAVRLMRSCLERAPDEVDLHRYYQETLRMAGRDAPLEEYRSLVAAHPESPMYHYLLGRVLADGSDESDREFRAAFDLDPNYAPAHRALGYSAALRGEWSEAVEYYDRFAALGSEEALEALDMRIRLRRRLNRPPSEIDRVLTETLVLYEDALQLAIMKSHLRLEIDSGALANEAAELIRRSETVLPDERPVKLAGNIRADLALTVGDLGRARDELSRLPRVDRLPYVALRLVLSSGSTEEDLKLLVEIPDWMAKLDPLRQLLALEFVGSIEREKTIQSWVDPDRVEIARLLAEPAELANADWFSERLSRESPAVRAAMYLAAARMLADATSREGVDARRAYLRAARSFGLPGELPWFGEPRGGRRSGRVR